MASKRFPSSIGSNRFTVALEQGFLVVHAFEIGRPVVSSDRATCARARALSSIRFSPIARRTVANVFVR